MKRNIPSSLHLTITILFVVFIVVIFWSVQNDYLFKDVKSTVNQPSVEVLSTSTSMLNQPVVEKAADATLVSDDESDLPPISDKMAKEIRRLSNRSDEGLLVEQRSDGTVKMDLQGRYQSVTAAVIDKDGQMIIRHGEDFLLEELPDELPEKLPPSTKAVDESILNTGSEEQK